MKNRKKEKNKFKWSRSLRPLLHWKKIGITMSAAAILSSAKIYVWENKYFGLHTIARAVAQKWQLLSLLLFLFGYTHIYKYKCVSVGTVFLFLSSSICWVCATSTIVRYVQLKKCVQNTRNTKGIETVEPRRHQNTKNWWKIKRRCRYEE